MAKPNIKPCPFCGEFLYYQPDWYNWVHPLGDDGYETPCIGNKIIIRDNNRTIADWNTRTDTIEAKLQAAEELAILLEVIMSVQETSPTPTLERARKALQKWKAVQDE